MTNQIHAGEQRWKLDAEGRLVSTTLGGVVDLATDLGDKRADVVSRLVTWLTSQSFTNVLLLAVLVANGAFFWFGLQAVQFGYDRMHDRYESTRKEENAAADRRHDSMMGTIKEFVREMQFQRQAGMRLDEQVKPQKPLMKAPPFARPGNPTHQSDISSRVGSGATEGTGVVELGGAYQGIESYTP